MKQILAAFLPAMLSAACLASEFQDGLDASLTEALMPSDGVSAVVSPYSATFAAGFLGEGIDNRETRVALGEKMGLGSTGFGVSFSRSRAKLAEWGRTNGVEVLFANSIWMRNYARVEPDFHAAAHRDFDVAFGPLSSLESMNAWSSVRTGGLVSRVVADVDPSCDTVLVCASGFDGAWSRPFPPAEKGVFHAAGGDVSLPFMKDVRPLRTLRRAGRTAFALMYRGGKLALYVVIPEDGKTPREVLASLGHAEMDLLDRAFLPDYRPEDDRGNPMPDVEGSSSSVVRLSMPKFSVETNVDLLPAFAALGVPKTGFDTICKDMRIGRALQCNVFVTSETGGEVGKVGLAPAKTEGEPPSISCDRPFAFLVRTVDRTTLLTGVFTGR